MNRRQLIAIAALSSLSIGSLVAVQVYQWWDVPPEEPYVILNAHEATVVRHICMAMFPAGDQISLDGGDLQIDRFFDQLLFSLGETEQKLIKFFLQTIDKVSYLSENRSRFLDLNTSQKQKFLEDWLQSSNYLLRNALLSVVTLLGMGYTSHPQISPYIAVYHRCGFG